MSKDNRNGFRKILIVNSHGGNGSLLSYFLRALHYRKIECAVLKFMLGIYKLLKEDKDRVRMAQKLPPEEE